MRRSPLYSPQADAALDAAEASQDDELLAGICDAVDLICDHGNSAEARREQLRTASGNAVWKVTVRTRHDDWVVLWRPKGRHAQIFLIGPL